MGQIKVLGFRSYEAYLHGKHWLALRAARLKTDGTCNGCGATSKLVLHHVCYARLGYELPRDVIVICSDCHSLLHKFLDQRYPGKDLEYQVKRTKDVWFELFGSVLVFLPDPPPSPAKARAKRKSEPHLAKRRLDSNGNKAKLTKREIIAAKVASDNAMIERVIKETREGHQTKDAVWRELQHDGC